MSKWQDTSEEQVDKILKDNVARVRPSYSGFKDKNSDFKVFTSGAQKDLTGKAPLHLIAPEMIWGLAEGLECGTRKGYAPNNWQAGLPIVQGHLAAAQRHMLKYIGGQNMNLETDSHGETFETHHLINAFVHLGMAVTQVKRNRSDLDDRYKGG